LALDHGRQGCWDLTGYGVELTGHLPLSLVMAQDAGILERIEQTRQEKRIAAGPCMDMARERGRKDVSQKTSGEVVRDLVLVQIAEVQLFALRVQL
jgi:hypothetical protein